MATVREWMRRLWGTLRRNRQFVTKWGEVGLSLLEAVQRLPSL